MQLGRWPLELNINWSDKLVHIVTGSQWLIFLWMDKFNFSTPTIKNEVLKSIELILKILLNNSW